MRSIVWILLMIVCRMKSYSQPTSGDLIGNIKTIEDSPIAGVSVNLIHRATGTRLQTISDRKGRFYIAGIYPGNTYLLRATHIQCKPVQLNSIEIEAGAVTEINVQMKEQISMLKGVTVQATIDKEGKYNNTVEIGRAHV